MIATETVMPRVAKQTMTFATDACPIVEADESEIGSRMKAIYLEQRAGFLDEDHEDSRKS